MLDDLRNHDATPNAEERSWIEFDPVLFMLKLSAIASVGIMIGLYAGLLAEPGTRTTAAAQVER